MANDKQPITVKKYANRRLYNTGSSTYVTLEDLAKLVKHGDDFIVIDAKSGEDITRSVLAQIIFEQEGKVGQSLLPATFLRQLIRFYGDSMQMMVPSYLDFALSNFAGEQKAMREKAAAALGAGAPMLEAMPILGAMEEQARKNIAMFNQALTVFNPFAPAAAETEGKPASAEKTAHAGKPAEPDLEDMKRRLLEMQQQIDGLARKE